MTRYLFLGGSKDGEEMDVPADRWDVRVLKIDSRPLSASISPFDTVDYEEEIYTRQKLRGATETFEVFTPSGWTGDMLIRHLLKRATSR